MPKRLLCIGMYCGMYWWYHYWYVLNTYQHVFNTNRYIFNTYQSILVCIELVLLVTYVWNCNTCQYRLNTYHNTYHNTCQIHCTRIGMYYNTYQHVSACIALVFGIYEIMIRVNTDQIHAFVFSMHAFVFQYVPWPIRTPIHSPRRRAQHNQIHTNTTSNTDQ